MKITLHDPPEGYEAEAEYRYADSGEFVITCLGVVRVKNGNNLSKWIVLTPKKSPADKLADAVETLIKNNGYGEGCYLAQCLKEYRESQK